MAIEKLLSNVDGVRLDAFISGELDISRSLAAELIDSGKVTVNGRLAKKSNKVMTGNEVAVELPELSEPEALPEDIPLDISKFPELCGVVDAIYNPLRSNLILKARERGIVAEGGLYMLVAQAVAAVEIFLGKKFSENVTEEVYLDILREKENIVLIGMPGCGKSTIGRRLAAEMGRKFYDLDEEIIRETGRNIPEIFASDGEKSFRDIESEVLMKNLADLGGAVIATGGGAILREENVKRLRRNGRLYFLNRPLSQLLPTPDRPLASSAEAIEARYRERLPKYLAAADVELITDGIAEHAVLDIRKEFGK